MIARHPTRWIAAFCDGQLPEHKARAIAAHLEQCEQCRRERDDILFTTRLLRELPLAHAPDDVWRRVEQEGEFRSDKQVREGDPAQDARDVSPRDVAQIRRAMHRALQASASRRPRLRRSVALGLTAAAALVLVIGALFIVPPHKEQSAAAAVAPQKASDRTKRREIQFQTPGGTKVFWVLTSDPNF